MGLKKQVIQFKDGKQICVFESAQCAADTIGITKQQISKCCNGILKSVKGYTFEYTGEVTNKHEDKGDINCPYCDRRFETYNGLCKHVFSDKLPHGKITQEKLLTDFKYNGVRPTCKCGCGEYTSIRYDGIGIHFCDYVLGHSSKIHNNWGHNENAIENSSETRRKQYKSGEREQWNKGKTWEETYSEEEIKRLTKIQREKIYRMLTESEFSLSSKIEKDFINECIEPLGIEYITQYYIKDLHHYCDVYVPDKKTIIEFQGDYWHGNPKKYLKEELSDFQLKKVEKDEILRKYCKDNNITLIEIWESDYNKDKENIKSIILNLLKT